MGHPRWFMWISLKTMAPEYLSTHAAWWLEGIVAKRVDAPYRSGRQDIWIKLKCVKSDTFPIVAFVEKLGARSRKIASLYVGRWDGDRLIYAGKARSGYSEVIARELRERLDSLVRRTSPLSVPVKKPKATWVEPQIDAETPTMVCCAQLSSRDCGTTLVCRALERHPSS